MQHLSLLPFKAEGERFASFSYHLYGGRVPSLTIEPNDVYFEHHTLLWKSNGVTIGIKKLSVMFNRFFSPMPASAIAIVHG